MPCVKWEEVEFTGFKVYKWNEYLFGNNLPQEEGLIVFRRDSSHVKRIVRFNIYNMVHPVPDLSTGQYSPCQDGLAFTLTLNDSNVFWIQPENQLIVYELNLFLLSFFKFSELTVSYPSRPRLVFVLDFSYKPKLISICWSSCQHHLLKKPAYVCTEPHVFKHQPRVRICDREENNALLMYPEDKDRDSDLEPREIDEMEDIVTQLRLYCTGVKETYWLPFCGDIPIGLVEVKAPSVVMLGEGVSSNCPICLYGMEIGESVVKTKCGHMLHKTCALPWLGFDVKCPICRSPSVTVL